MRKLYTVGLVVIAGLIIGLAYAEEITFSTYYPAPFGKYREFSTTGLTTLATDEFGIEGANARVGIGTTDPLSKLHLILGPNLGTLALQANAPNVGVDIQWYDSDDVVNPPTWSGNYKWDLSYRSGNASTPPDSLMLWNSTPTPIMTWAQSGNIGIGTTEPQAALEITSTDNALLPPRFATHNAIVTNIISPVEGMMAYNLENHVMEYYNDTDWVPMGGGTEGGHPTTKDSNSAEMLVSRTYLAQTAGFVTARPANETTNGLYGYVGDTTTLVEGTVVAFSDPGSADPGTAFTSFFVAKNKYFGVTSSSACDIIWTPLVSGGGNPVYQN